MREGSTGCREARWASKVLQMFDFLKALFLGGFPISAQEILLRLVIAALFGGAVALERCLSDVE